MLPKTAKSTFAAAAKAVNKLFEETQPKLSEDMPEMLSFGISEANAAFQTAEAAVATVKSLMERGALGRRRTARRPSERASSLAPLDA